MGELLSRVGITQIEVAKRMKVTQSLVSQWVRGICEPRIEQIPVLADFLGVTVNEIIDCFRRVK